MRSAVLAVVMTLAGFAPVSAQTAAQNPYGLDPYNPRDAEILRNYGSVLVSQTPLSELRKLDPYNPTQAALLRGLGGGIPLWAPWYLPGPVPGSSPLFPAAASSAAPNVLVVLLGELPAEAAPAAPAASAAPVIASPEAVATLRRPESNDGVWIAFSGQRWISGGAAVPFMASEFIQVGNYNDFPVYRRSGAAEEVIYLPVRQDRVAPYRLKGAVSPAP
jgi:hypothetical protein